MEAARLSSPVYGGGVGPDLIRGDGGAQRTQVFEAIVEKVDGMQRMSSRASQRGTAHSRPCGEANGACTACGA